MFKEMMKKRVAEARVVHASSLAVAEASQNEEECIDDCVSVVESQCDVDLGSNMDRAIASNKLQIKTCLEDINTELMRKEKYRDDLIKSIMSKKEELRESDQRTSQIRIKNEEISMMIQAEDKDANVIHANLKKEMDTLQFFETQVSSAQKLVQKLKREANKNRLKHAENRRLMSEGMETLRRAKAEVDQEMKTKRRECLALQEKAKALGDPEEVYAMLLNKREQLAALKNQVDERAAAKVDLKAQLGQSQDRRSQAKAESEALSEQLRKLTEIHEAKMKTHAYAMEVKRVNLEDGKRQVESKEKMVAMEREYLEGMKRSLAVQETEKAAMKNNLDQSAVQYNQLKEEILKLNLQEQQLDDEFKAKQDQHDQINKDLNSRQPLVLQKKSECNQIKAKIESLKMMLIERETRKGDLERSISEKEREGQKQLEDTLRQMEVQCERDLSALDEEWKRTESELEMLIGAVEERMKKVGEDQEIFILNHVTNMEKLAEQDSKLSEQISAAQNQMVYLALQEEQLSGKLTEMQKSGGQQIESLKANLEEKKKEMEQTTQVRAQEIETLQAKKQEAETMNNEAEVRVETVMKQKQESEITLEQITKRIEQLQVDNTKQDEEVAQLLKQMDEKADEEERTLAEIGSIKKEILQLQEKCTSLMAQVDTVVVDNQQVVQEIQQKKATISELETEKQKSQALLEELDAEMEQLRITHSSEIEERILDQKNQRDLIEEEKEAEHLRHKIQYQKLMSENELAKKAVHDATDELLAIKAEHATRLQTFQSLVSKKEKLDAEYKKYVENDSKLQKFITNIAQSTK